jgi:hypothetical protein
LVFQFGFCENLGFNRCGTTSLFHFGLAALIGAGKKLTVATMALGVFDTSHMPVTTTALLTGRELIF